MKYASPMTGSVAREAYVSCLRPPAIVQHLGEPDRLAAFNDVEPIRRTHDSGERIRDRVRARDAVFGPLLKTPARSNQPMLASRSESTPSQIPPGCGKKPWFVDDVGRLGEAARSARCMRTRPHGRSVLA
jgi:hypothetical protein